MLSWQFRLRQCDFLGSISIASNTYFSSTYSECRLKNATRKLSARSPEIFKSAKKLKIFWENFAVNFLLFSWKAVLTTRTKKFSANVFTRWCYISPWSIFWFPFIDVLLDFCGVFVNRSWRGSRNKGLDSNPWPLDFLKRLLCFYQLQPRVVHFVSLS